MFQALAKLRQLEEENLTLRNQLFTSNDEIFQLQATIATIEVEAKFQATQEVNNIQSQLKFKVIHNHSEQRLFETYFLL